MDDEQIVRRELRKEGVHGNIIITPTELEENAPQEPPEPILDLIVEDYRGKEIDPIIGQAYDQFINVNNFDKSRAFKQFLWRINMHNFQLRCMKIKVEQPNVEESTIEEVVKDELT